MMRLSLSFPGIAPIAATLPAVHAAERCGLDGIWCAEHIGFRDAVVPAAAYLRECERLEVGICGTSIAGRHPGLLAMELASLAELGVGRVRVQVGTGDASLIARLGARVETPVHTIEELVKALRVMLAGREVDGDYPGYAFRRFQLMTPAVQVPIDVMAVRPRMVRTAARVADGLSLSMGASAAYLADVVRTVAAELGAQGRHRASFRITAHTPAVIADDLAAARLHVLPVFGLFEPTILDCLGRGVVAPSSFAAAANARGLDGVLDVLRPEVVDAMALVSTPDGLDRALARYAATGIDELAVTLVAPPEDQPRLVELLAAARAAWDRHRRPA